MIKLKKFTRRDITKVMSWKEGKDFMLDDRGFPDVFFLTWRCTFIDSLANKNKIAFMAIELATKETVGYCEGTQKRRSFKLDSILIGDKQKRGKGLGLGLVKTFVTFVFQNTDCSKISLDVFDLNVEAIKCYEKAGFKIDPKKAMEITFGDYSWQVSVMVLNLKTWQKNQF